MRNTIGLYSISINDDGMVSMEHIMSLDVDESENMSIQLD